MKALPANLKTPAIAIGALLLLIGLLQLLHFPQSMQNAVQSAFGPAVVVCLAGWILHPLFEKYRSSHSEEVERARLLECCLLAAERGMRTAAELTQWQLQIDSKPLPESFYQWNGSLGQLRLLASEELLKAALSLHEKFLLIITNRQLESAEEATFGKLRDYDLLRAQKLPPESSEENERLMARAVRMHEEGRRILSRRAGGMVTESLVDQQINLLAALRREFNNASVQPASYDARLKELAALTHEAQVTAETNIRSLLAPSVRPAR